MAVAGIAISEVIRTDLITIALGVVFLLIYLKFRVNFRKNPLFSLKYDNLFLTLLVPVAVSFVFLISFRFFSGIPLLANDIPLLLSLFSVVLLGPFFEELFLRGLLLGGSFFFASRTQSKFFSCLFITLGFILQLFIFVWIHSHSLFIKNLFIFCLGLISSLMFIFYKRSLIPPMIFHAFTNLFVIMNLFS